jgi:hypothetical protein
LEAAKARKAEALVTKKVVKKEETLTPKILQMKLNHLIAQRGKKGENVRKQITTLRVLSSRVSTTVKPWLLVVGCWLLVVGCWLLVVVGCLFLSPALPKCELLKYTTTLCMLRYFLKLLFEMKSNPKMGPLHLYSITNWAAR